MDLSRNRTLLNLLLLAAAAMLGAALWLDRRAEPPPEPLTPLSAGEIAAMRVEYPGSPAIALKRTDAGWRLTSPVEGRAEGSEVRRILRLAGTEVRREYPAGEIEAAGAGLAEPPYTVVFTDDEGGKVRIALGDETPLESGRYARVGDTVYLIPEPDIRALDAEFSDLVARDLLAGDAELVKIELPDATLTRAETGGWKVTPEDADRGADAAQKTVDAWRNARALWMKPASGSKPGAGSTEAEAGSAEARVRLHLADGTARELTVVGRKPQLILRDPALNVDYHVAADRAGPLLDMAHDDNDGSAPLSSS